MVLEFASQFSRRSAKACTLLRGWAIIALSLLSVVQGVMYTTWTFVSCLGCSIVRDRRGGWRRHMWTTAFASAMATRAPFSSPARRGGRSRSNEGRCVKVHVLRGGQSPTDCAAQQLDSGSRTFQYCTQPSKASCIAAARWQVYCKQTVRDMLFSLAQLEAGR